MAVPDSNFRKWLNFENKNHILKLYVNVFVALRLHVLPLHVQAIPHSLSGQLVDKGNIEFHSHYILHFARFPVVALECNSDSLQFEIPAAPRVSF